MKPLTASHSSRKIDGVACDVARSDSPWGLPDRAGCALSRWPLPGRPAVLPDEMPLARRACYGLALVVLAGLCAVLVHWGACSLPAANPHTAEFCLQAGVSSFKLNSTSAGARPAGSSGPALPTDTIKRHTVRKKPPCKEEPPLELAEPLPKVPVEPKKKPAPPPEELLIAPPEGVPEKPAPPAPAKDKELVVPLDPPRSGPVETPNPVVPVAAAELAPMCSYALYVLHQGDIPMTRTWKTFGLQTALAAALVVAPAASNAAPEDTKINGKDLAKKIESLDKELKSLKQSIESINKELLKVKGLEGSIKSLEDSLEDIKENVKGSLENAKKDMDGFRKDMGKVLATLDELAKKNTTSTAKEVEELKARLDKIDKKLDVLRPDVSVRRYPPPTELGRVLLVNRYPEEITFIVNGTSYRLAPGGSRLIDGVPAGSFTYEVLSPSYGMVTRRTRTLLPNETSRIVVDLP